MKFYLKSQTTKRHERPEVRLRLEDHEIYLSSINSLSKIHHIRDSKVFEKFVNARLMKFIESNHILSEHQYGFRHGYSTKLSLINLRNEITKLTDEGRVTAGIFIDFAKAFDTIDHTILLNKMCHYGVRGLH